MTMFDKPTRWVLAALLLALIIIPAGRVLTKGNDFDNLLEELKQDENKDDLALISNSFLGELRYWNGVDSEGVSLKDGWAPGTNAIAAAWGWRYNANAGKLFRISGKQTPISALVAVPSDGKYRIWLRRMADKGRAFPVALKLSGVNTAEHMFGKIPLTGESSQSQEKTHPIRFEDEAVRGTFPSAACRVWEYWDLDLKKGDTLFELQPEENEAPCTHLFVSASKTFTPRWSLDPYNVLIPTDTYSTLSRVYYRFRIRDADAKKYKITNARLMYHSKFDPKKDTFGEGIWSVGMGQTSLADRRSGKRSVLPMSASGQEQIPCGEWSGWIDSTWSALGAGSWATGVLELNGVTKGMCDIELAWHTHPAAVLKRITVDIVDSMADSAGHVVKFSVPLIHKGRAKIVFPDRANQQGIWGVWGQQYIDRFKSVDGFNQQYIDWIAEAKQNLGIKGEIRIPDGVNFFTAVKGNLAEQRVLTKILVSMGFNRIEGVAPDIAGELGLQPLVMEHAPFHTTDPGDPARKILVHKWMEEKKAAMEKQNPELPGLVNTMVVGDEIGCIAGLYKINQSIECLKLFRQYLADVLKEKNETPAFFGVESLEQLKCQEDLPENAGVFERRLYNHSVKFRRILTGYYYQSITDAAREFFPNALTYANYSPAPMRQGDQVHGLTWFQLPRMGSLTLAWGEDWVYPIGSFTGYEIISYYSALTECAARPLKSPSGFYNVAGGSVLHCDTHIVSSLSRNLKYLDVYSFGPSYNTTGADEWEGCWSDIKFVYTDILKAFRAAAHIGQTLAKGKIEQRKVALLYNIDHEIMHGGIQGEHSDRALTFAALANCNRNADIILSEDLTSAEFLSQYSALYIGGYCLPRASVPVIRDWVEKGGLLVAAAGSGIGDEYGLPLPEMEEVFGAGQKGLKISKGYFTPIRMNSHKSIATITIKETDFSPALTGEVIGVKTTIEPTTAQSIATFEDGTCAAAINHLGKGHVLLWGVQPGFLYKGRRDTGNNYKAEMSRFDDERLAIFEKPMRKVMGESPLSCDGGQIELTRFELGDEIGVLVNNFKRYAWSAELPPMTVRMQLPASRKITKVTSAASGELAWKQEADWLIITSPVPETVDSILAQ